MTNKTTIPEHRLLAIESAANQIQTLAKQLMFNNSLRGRAITEQAEQIKAQVKELKEPK